MSDIGELGVIAWVLRNVKKKVGFWSSDFIDTTSHFKNRLEEWIFSFSNSSLLWALVTLESKSRTSFLKCSLSIKLVQIQIYQILTS